MSILTKMLKQTCVYWAPGSMETGGRDFNDYGSPMYASPVELSCRWEDRASEYINRDGVSMYSKSIVYVGIDVEVGGVLFLGTLDDIVDSDEPKKNDNAWEIQGFDKIPNLRGAKFVRKAYL